MKIILLIEFQILYNEKSTLILVLADIHGYICACSQQYIAIIIN